MQPREQDTVMWERDMLTSGDDWVREKACWKKPCLQWDPGSGFQAEGEVSAKM